MTKNQRLSLAVAIALGLAGPALAQPRQAADFLRTAIQGDNSEIMLGRMAANNPTASPAVRRFGQQLAGDHMQARQQTVGLARAFGVQPPNGPTMMAQAERAKLGVLRGRSFDREFVNYMVHDHEKDIGDFRQESFRGHGAVSRLARNSLPKLRQHLNIALTLQGRLR